jgi:hypothetical protein
MLNIPLFLIRQYQIQNSCRRLKGIEFSKYYKLVLINGLQLIIFINLKKLTEKLKNSHIYTFEKIVELFSKLTIYCYYIKKTINL